MPSSDIPAPREILQRRPLREVDPLGPVGVHDAIVVGAVQSLLARPLPELEREAGVGDDIGWRRVDQPLVLEPLADPVLERGP